MMQSFSISCERHEQFIILSIRCNKKMPYSTPSAIWVAKKTLILTEYLASKTIFSLVEITLLHYFECWSCNKFDYINRNVQSQKKQACLIKALGKKISRYT